MLVAQILVPVAVGLAVVVGVVLGLRAGSSAHASAAMKQVGATAMEAFEAFLGRLYLVVFGGALVLALAAGGAVGAIERDAERGALAGAAVVVGALGGAMAGIAGSMFAARTGVGAAASAQRSENAAGLASLRGSGAGVLLAGGLGVGAVAGLFAAYSSVLGNDMEESALLTLPVALGAAWTALAARATGALTAASTGSAMERLNGLPQHDPRNPGVAAAMLGRAAGAAGGQLEFYGVAVLGTAAALVLGGLLTGITGEDGWLLLPLALAAAGVIVVALTLVLAGIVRAGNAGLVVATVLSLAASAGLTLAFVEEEWWWFAAAAGLGNVGPLALLLAGRLAGARRATVDEGDEVGSMLARSLAAGMRGAAFAAVVLAAIVAGAWALGEQGAIREFGAERAGMYGVALAAVGMLMPAGYLFAVAGASGLARNGEALAVIAFDVAPETRDSARLASERLTSSAGSVSGLLAGVGLVAMVAGVLAFAQVVRVEIAEVAVDDPGRYARMLQGAGAAPAGIDIEAAITHGVSQYRGLLEDAETAVGDEDDFGEREISRLLLADRAETAGRVRALVEAGSAETRDLRDLEASPWPLPRVLPAPVTRAPVVAGALGGVTVLGLLAGAALRGRRTATANLVAEVRRQFVDTPGVSSGEVRADYARAGDVATKGALGRVLVAALMAVLAAIVAGYGLRWAYGGEGNEGWWALAGLAGAAALAGGMLALGVAAARGAAGALRARAFEPIAAPEDGDAMPAARADLPPEVDRGARVAEGLFGGVGETLTAGALFVVALALVIAPFTVR